MAYITPDNLTEAWEALARGARVIAGGTDFYPAGGDTLPKGDVLDITRLKALSGISETPQGWRIGATTRWAEIAAAELPPGFDALRQAAGSIGAIQVQNAATIGGNLCNASPAADGVPPLLVLDAEVELARPGATRRLPLAAFLTGARQTALAPGELLIAIHVPAAAATAKTAFVKLGSRAYMVISFVMAAVAVETEGGRIKDARIAVGACAPVAQRLAGLEAALIGQPEAVLARPGLITPDHLAGLAPIDDLRADAAYRSEAAATLVGRALGNLAGQSCGGADV